MAKLGFHIAAGMMQGLGAGIIENAKQKREAALRAMEIEVRRQEGAADRASREATTAKELASREAISGQELGMRGRELEGAREDRKLARDENQQYRQDTLAETRRYHNILDKNADDRTGGMRDPNKVSDKDIIESILTEVEKSKDVAGRPTKKAEEIAARYPERPEVLKRFGVQAPKEGSIVTEPTEKAPAAATPPTGGPVLPKNHLEMDRLKAEFAARKFPDEASRAVAREELKRRLQELMK